MSILANIHAVLGADGVWEGDGEFYVVIAGVTRAVTTAEIKQARALMKTEEIYREQEIRSATVYGKEVDRHFFAWVEELYADVIKAAARNPIDANTPITNGLRLLRDNRNTLLNGLEAWVDDPAKTAEDIAGFDVVGWSGWSVARP